jgi:trigger factor
MAVETGIQITKTGEEPGAKHLKVEVQVGRVQEAETKATKQYAKRARLPGFRPGKAPLAVVRKQYREAIRESVIRELIGESWKAALDQEDLKPIADPRIRDLKFEDDAPVTFELLVEVKPKIELPRTSGFTLTRAVQSITDEMVDRQLDELRRQKAPWAPVEGERPARGDLVSASIQTATAGVEKAAEAAEAAASTWGEESTYQIELGTGQALPDVESLILTAAPGETVEGTATFPDDFPDESRRGQSRRVRVTVHETKRQQLPPLDDAFAREMGDFETIDALRAAVRGDLEGEARRDADAEVRRQLIDRLVEANQVPAPSPMVQRALSAFAQAYQVPDDQIERFVQEFQPIAERQVRRDLIIDRVAELHGLYATEEDVDRRIKEIAERRGVGPGQVYTSLQKAGRLKELERNLTEEKVFEHLLAQSSVKNS